MTPETTPDLNSQTIHCLVHPGFDVYDQPEFESYLHGYIENIAKTTNDILLIVSHGERYDLEQMRQFALLDIIQAIGFFLAQIQVSPNMKYEKMYEMYWLTEDFFEWCMSNIGISELIRIEEEQIILRDTFLEKRSKWEISFGNIEHKQKCDSLNERSAQAMKKIDIEALAYKALEELWKINNRETTEREVRNRWRFFRIIQHAMHSLWSDRVREIFIRDGEDAEVLPILPVLQYKGSEWEKIPTYVADMPWDFPWCEFHASEFQQYWNAAELRDRIITELSVSRNSALAAQKPKEVLADMWVEVTSDTRFVFLWEYRNRCVDNVFRVMNYRMSPITWDEWFIAHDVFTLERPKNHMSFDWI